MTKARIKTGRLMKVSFRQGAAKPGKSARTINVEAIMRWVLLPLIMISSSAFAQTKPIVVFSCSFGLKRVEVLKVNGAYVYRYGNPAAAPDIELRSNGGDGKAYQSAVVGGGGGHEDTIRFIQNDYSYMVSSGEAGRLTDIPGKRWSVLTVEKGQKEVARHACVEVISPLRVPPELPEDPDQDFVMWH